MESLKVARVPLAVIAASTVSMIVPDGICWQHLIWRQEVLHYCAFVLGCYIYVQIVIDGIRYRMRGENLQMFDLQHYMAFEPPEFVDKGFNDLQKEREYWKMTHKNFSYCSTQGYRPYMEDRMHYMYDPNMNLSIFGIFDGHGGMYVANFLEANYTCSLRDRLIKLGTKRKLSTETASVDDKAFTKQVIVTEVIRLDDEISHHDPVLTSYTGSTLISVIMQKNRYMSVVNVGDSRAVGCSAKNKAVALSHDHKPDNPEEQKRVERRGGFVVKDDSAFRINGILAVSRAFGDTHLKRCHVLTAYPDVICVDLVKTPLKFVIVATDGFWDVISNKEAVRLANQYLRSHDKRDWHRISTFLVSKAIQKHTKDNVSVLFIRL